MFYPVLFQRNKKKQVFTLYVIQTQCRDWYRLKPVFFGLIHCIRVLECVIICFAIVKYNELSQKTRFQSVRIAAFCLYNIQHENLIIKKISQYIYSNMQTFKQENVFKKLKLCFIFFTNIYISFLSNHFLLLSS